MLHGNYSVYLKSPGRWLGGNSTAGQAHVQARSNFGRAGEFRSGTLRDGAGAAAAPKAATLIAIPAGYGAQGWRIPSVAGDMRGAASITLGAVGNLEQGWDTGGTASITLGAEGTVNAVASVAGTASITLGAEGTAYGVASVAGTATITLGAEGTLFATAPVAGTASITLGAVGTLFATAQVAGTAHFSAAAEGATLTEAGIATAVWSAASGANNATGTMGEKLNDAGSASNPWTEDLSGAQAAGTAGFMLKVIQQVLRNKQITDPATGVMTVYEDDGTTVLFAANLKEDAAGAQAYRGQGAERRERLE